jgi:glyoxylase I family protein
MAYQRRQLLQALSCAVGSSFILPQDGFAITHQDSAQVENPAAPAKKATEQDSPGTQVEKVAGIGGFFFRAHDPAALARWYQQHLGIALTPAKENDTVWQQEAGPTSFTPFPKRPAISAIRRRCG